MFNPNETIPIVAGILVSGAVIWRAVRYVFKVDKALPVLLKIAEQFETNGGESLRDQINKINIKLDESKTATLRRIEELDIQHHYAVKIAEDSRLVAQTNAKIVEELTNTQVSDLIHIREYLHEKMHSLSNQVAVVTGSVELNYKMYQKIEKRIDDLIPFVKRHREDDDDSPSQ